MHHPTLPWSRRLATVAIVATALTPLLAVGASAGTATQGCTDPDGVTVVVDATDLGGGIEIGCATGTSTGTEALAAAGFSETRDDAGMICAIDSLPDPCPATFEGSYWSYWHAEDGEWLAWMEGSDTATPEPGGVEGWRYNDGSTGPGVSPEAALVADVPEGGSDPAVQDTEPAIQGDPWVYAVVAAAILATALVAGITLARRGRSLHGPGGQD